MCFLDKQYDFFFFNMKKFYLCGNIPTKLFHSAFGANIYMNLGVPLKLYSRKFWFLKEQFMQ